MSFLWFVQMKHGAPFLSSFLAQRTHEAALDTTFSQAGKHARHCLHVCQKHYLNSSFVRPLC